MAGLTHNHFCRHDDHHFSHQDEVCVYPYDVSRWHDCAEGDAYRKRMAVLLGEGTSGRCKYGCTKDCSHPDADVVE